MNEMNEYFGEKSQQISPCGLTAFGIQLSSRYGKTKEMVQMINFAELAAKMGIEKAVKEVFYDSPACICSFTLSPFVQKDDAIGSKIHAAAKETIMQFLLFGNIDHRTGFEDVD